MNNLAQQVLDLAIEIQQIPSPTFQEKELAHFLKDRFATDGLKNIEIDSLGNVYACWPGGGLAAPIVISAHSDTVFPLATDLTVKQLPEEIHGPGIGDNSLGVAGLFGLLWGLRANNFTPPGDLWLVTNVCEEGLGDLKGMRAVIERFGHEPKAYIIVEGMALGQIYHRGLGVQRYRISARAEGGHSWVDFGKPSAIHELAALITKITKLPIPKLSRTSFNVGVITGGTTVNTIAAEASLELDLRSEGAESLQKMVGLVETLVAESNTEGVHFQAEIIGKRPAGEISPEHPLVKLGIATLENLGIQAHLNIGSTDANIPLSLGLPSICIGLTNGKGAHTVNEFIHTPPLEKGLSQLIQLTTKAFDL